MENCVDLVFTEAYLMPKKHYQLLGRSSMEIEESEPQKSQSYNIVKVPAPVEADFSDFPDLNQPLPEVSIREQLRLTSVNRGKVLSWQRGQQRHLEAMWHSHPSGDQFRGYNQGLSSLANVD